MNPSLCTAPLISSSACSYLYMDPALALQETSPIAQLGAAAASCNAIPLLTSNILQGFPNTAPCNESPPPNELPLHPGGVLSIREPVDSLLEKVLPVLLSSPKQSNRRSSNSRHASFNGERKSILHELQQNPMGKDGLSRRLIHKYNERQRRKSMSSLFGTLQALLPVTKSRQTNRCTLLTEVIEYIESLQGKMKGLSKEKAEVISFLKSGKDYDTTSTGSVVAKNDVPESPNLDHGTSRSFTSNLQLCTATNEFPAELSNENDIFITLTSPRRKGIWSGILLIFQEHNAEVVNVTLSSATSADTYFHCIQAKVLNKSGLGSDDLPELLQQIIASKLKLRGYSI